VKYGTTTLAILAAVSVSVTLAEDFKTLNGKEYKDATVIRVEPDVVMIKTKSGMTKLYFVELPKEDQRQKTAKDSFDIRQRTDAVRSRQVR
jgi:hypothetical protein